MNVIDPQQYIQNLNIDSNEGMNVVWEMLVAQNPTLPPSSLWSENNIVKTLKSLQPHNFKGDVRGDAKDFLVQEVQGPFVIIQSRLRELAEDADMPPISGEKIYDYIERIGKAALKATAGK